MCLHGCHPRRPTYCLHIVTKRHFQRLYILHFSPRCFQIMNIHLKNGTLLYLALLTSCIRHGIWPSISRAVTFRPSLDFSDYNYCGMHVVLPMLTLEGHCLLSECCMHKQVNTTYYYSSMHVVRPMRTLERHCLLNEHCMRVSYWHRNVRITIIASWAKL